MLRQSNSTKNSFWLKRRGMILITAVFIATMMPGALFAETVKQRTFTSPEKAVKALVEALESKDVKELEAILGPESNDLVSSGDPVADNAEYERFISHYREKSRLQEESAERALLYVGKEDWPFPIPVVKRDYLWHFDTEEGREEILARRIGRNELSVIQVCLAYVDAQREYALKAMEDGRIPEYAQKFVSDPGKKDGLYWDVIAGDEQSPLGPLLAEAQEKGYAIKQPAGEPSPYYGYYYKILSAQGEHAPGGAYDYRVNGKMIGGFAMVAYPAKYGSSGVMTFVVNHDGIVYQKDLGEGTEEAAQALKLFNPDSTWQKVGEKDTKAEG